MGQISCSMIFRLQKMRVRVNFEGGSLTSQGIVPAIYKTSDTLIQHIIESSDKFNSGAVYVKESVDLGEEEPEEEKPKPSPLTNNLEDTTTPSSDIKEYPEVTNFQTAKSILMTQFKVELKDLQDKAAALSVASSLGVSFPNWK